MIVTLALAAAAPTYGRPRAVATFDVPATTLADAVIAVGRQGHADIGLDSSLGGLRTQALRGRYTVEQALRRLLKNAPAAVVRVDAGAYRIVRRAPPPAKPIPRIAESPRPVAPLSLSEVVVVGSKRDTRLDRYPGGVAVADGAAFTPAIAARGSDAVVERIPVLASTYFGPGRDKLFIRGVADSSFSGLSQATVGQYLGDVRLNFSAPDPDLALYDLRAVEVLEGPQGTLYGAGALGGILRFEPQPPDLARFGGSMAIGATTIAHGAPGSDAVGILNVPIVDDRLAVRAVAYRTIEGGYIDDGQRGLANVNRTSRRGGRGVVRLASGPWTIDLGGVAQDIDNRDAQYAERGRPPLTRFSAIAQPFDADYRMGSLVVRRDAGAVRLTSATSLVRQRLATVYDATGLVGVPALFGQNERVSVLTNETRVARTGRAFDWVLGVEALRNAVRVRRRLGPVAAPNAITGIVSNLRELSVFGEATFRPTRGIALTFGGRAVSDRRNDETFDTPGSEIEPTRTDRSFLPSLGALWSITPSLSGYLRYQEGFRAGGLSVAGVAADAVERFRSDTIATIEGGLRYRRGSALNMTMGLSRARWENVQADLVTAAGFPFTDNIGSGRILSLEAQAEWRPTRAVRMEGAVFVNDSRLAEVNFNYVAPGDYRLPNIAAVVARAGIHHTTSLFAGELAVGGSVRYVGRSRFGIGRVLNLRQGGSIDTTLNIAFVHGPYSVSLDATNLADASTNIFALGNPFQVADRREITPLRPRAVRIGIARTF